MPTRARNIIALPRPFDNLLLYYCVIGACLKRRGLLGLGRMNHLTSAAITRPAFTESRGIVGNRVTARLRIDSCAQKAILVPDYA